MRRAERLGANTMIAGNGKTTFIWHRQLHPIHFGGTTDIIHIQSGQPARIGTAGVVKNVSGSSWVRPTCD